MKNHTKFKILTASDLRELYELHYEGVRRFIYYKVGDMDTSEDILQEVFLKIWTKRKEIRIDTVKSLIYTIASNLVINHFNHQKVVFHHRESTPQTTYGASPQFILEEKEYEEKVNQVLASIPEGCREVFLMHRLDDLKYEEIADRMGLTVKAIEKRMSKAIAIVKENLGRKL